MKSDMTENTNVRKAVVSSLVAFSKFDRYSNLEVSSALSKYSFSDADRRLYTRLVYGVIEREITLDYIISQYSSRPIEKIDLTTLSCIRMGLYQLLYSDKIPDHAAVSETVAVSPRASKGFVNAVLREFLRHNKRFSVPESKLGRLSVLYSCPEELCDFFIKSYGDETAEKILSSLSSKAPVYIRANTLKTTAERLIGEVFENSSVSDISSDVIVTDKVVFDADSSDWFVQDLSSRLAVKALGAKKGETVVDTCSAPGGKSFSIAIDMENEGKIYSFDLHANKVSLIRKGAERLGISIIEASECDARSPQEQLVGKADRVLCDAPCSGLGVISKKPEIKYKSLEHIERLPDVQLEVLKGASKYVKEGGVLVYSTCTLNPAENEGVVRRFLESERDFAPAEFAFSDSLCSREGMLTIFPYDINSDGFFISKFTKKRTTNKDL